MTYHALRGRTRYPGAIDGRTIPSFSLSNILLWYDFSDVSTLFTDAGITNVMADSDKIYQVNDKSGNGYNGTQTTEGSRPLYKTAVKNGLSVGRFNGVSTTGSHFNITMSAASGSFTMISCFYDNITGASYNNPRGIFDTEIGQLIFLRQTNVDLPTFGYYDGTYRNVGSIAHQVWEINSWVLNANISTGYCFRNGEQIGSSLPYSAKAIGGRVRLCAFQDTLSNYLLAADVCEVLLYSSALSDTNRQSVEAYLNSKWAIY